MKQKLIESLNNISRKILYWNIFQYVERIDCYIHYTDTDILEYKIFYEGMNEYSDCMEKYAPSLCNILAKLIERFQKDCMSIIHGANDIKYSQLISFYKKDLKYSINQYLINILDQISYGYINFDTLDDQRKVGLSYSFKILYRKKLESQINKFEKMTTNAVMKISCDFAESYLNEHEETIHIDTEYQESNNVSYEISQQDNEDWLRKDDEELLETQAPYFIEDFNFILN